MAQAEAAVQILHPTGQRGPAFAALLHIAPFVPRRAAEGTGAAPPTRAAFFRSGGRCSPPSRAPHPSSGRSARRCSPPKYARGRAWYGSGGRHSPPSRAARCVSFRRPCRCSPPIGAARCGTPRSGGRCSPPSRAPRRGAPRSAGRYSPPSRGHSACRRPCRNRSLENRAADGACTYAILHDKRGFRHTPLSFLTSAKANTAARRALTPATSQPNPAG